MNGILEKLRNVLVRDYPNDKDSLSFLPDQDSITLSKLAGGMSSTDTCATTKRFHRLYKEELGVYEGYCWNHMRDLWIGGTHKGVNKWAKGELENSIKHISSVWRVSSDVKDIIHSMHKEFSLTANYPKVLK